MYESVESGISRGRRWVGLLAGAVLFAPVAHSIERPIRLDIDDPRGTAKAMLESEWMLSFHIAAIDENAGFYDVILPSGGPRFKSFIVRNPDDCLDLTGADPELVGSPVEFCTAGPDETLLRFDLDAFDIDGVSDVGAACTGEARDRLTDTSFGDIATGVVDFRDANKAFIDVFPLSQTNNSVIVVGPRTGGPLGGFGEPEDCYGYGADDDIPSLVVMVNIGAARVFDRVGNYGAPRIRNMAGLLSSTHRELVGREGRTAIVGQMRITRGMMEPITLIDVNDTITFGTTFTDPVLSRKIEDGPIEAFPLSGTFSPSEMVEEVHKLLPGEYEIEIRAVIVDGVAPDFIDDNNGDGRITAWDLTRAAEPYTLLSNESVRKFTVLQREVLTEEVQEFECPDDTSLKYADLDGNGLTGGCQDGDGSSRSVRRVPR